jgi:hypothetical protein
VCGAPRGCGTATGQASGVCVEQRRRAVAALNAAETPAADSPASKVTIYGCSTSQRPATPDHDRNARSKPAQGRTQMNRSCAVRAMDPHSRVPAERRSPAQCAVARQLHAHGRAAQPSSSTSNPTSQRRGCGCPTRPSSRPVGSAKSSAVTSCPRSASSSIFASSAARSVVIVFRT